MSTLDFLGHLQTESAMFLDAAQAAAPAARVPSCPDWDADDLLWHLGEVQWFWATIVADDLRTGQQIEDLVEPERPADRAGLLAFYREQSPRLHSVAAEADPAEPRWMWVSDEALHDVAYVRRRQAHEALVHRVDAELTAGRPISPIDVGLAADGVDEAVVVMFGNHPSWGTFTPGDQRVRVRATDAERSWLVRLGRFAGTSSQGEAVDVPSWQAVDDDGRDADATVTGSAADLDLWLWGRPVIGSEPVLTGDQQALATFRAVRDDGVG